MILAALNFSPGLLAVPVAVIFLIVAIALILRAAASRYVKVGPDEIAVFSGRKYKTKGPDGQVMVRGFDILQGGGRILWPVVEKVEIIKTAAFQVEVAEQNVPNKNNVGVNVKGVATCKLSLADEDLANAISNFLNKEEGDRIQFIQNILKGHVRSIVGNLTIDQLLRERQKLNEQVVNESAPECKRLGIQVLNLVIQDVRDEHGYIEALGKQQIAATMRDAAIATAEADRETQVKTSNAQREAAEAKAQNEAKIAEAQKERDLKVAQFKQETESKRAVAETAFGIAAAEQQQRLKVAEANRDQAEIEAQALVQEKEAQRKKKELEATLLTQAEANRQAAIIKAEADRKVAELEAETQLKRAEGERNSLIKRGEGEAQKRQITAEAEAEATRKTLTAAADGERAKLEAQARGIEASKLAEAKGVEAMLLAQALGKQKALVAEAEGTRQLAEALQKLSEQGKLILILDRLPNLLDKGGDAGAKIANAIFGPVAAGVSKMGPITITDLGGGATTEKGLASAGTLVPKIVTDFFTHAKMRGIDLSPLLSFLKMDPSALVSMLGPVAGAPAPAAPAEAASATSAPSGDGK